MPLRNVEMKGKVSFQYADRRFVIKGRERLKAIVKQIFSDHQKILQDVQFILCSDNYLLDINQRFLQHDTYTDIVTFTLSEPETPIHGEVYISVDRLRENAKEFKVTEQLEFARLIFHGTLHLNGYEDETSELKDKIHQMEDYYLDQL